MKTLDDALMTPGVIRPDSYDIGAGTVWMHSIGGEIALGGHGFTPAILRRIADHLDPPMSLEEAKREAEVRDDIEFGHFLDWTIALDKARAEAKREGLQEAVRVCDALQQKHNISFYGVVDRARDGVRNLELAGAAAAGMETSARQAAVAIRALIEKERA